MQFLPSSTTISFADQTVSVNTSANASSGGSDSFNASGLSDEESFDKVLSSFISAGRESYAGMPEGFAGLEENVGTMAKQNLGLLKNALKKRNIQEESLAMLDQLAASGQGLTVTRIMSTLMGKERISASLDDNERMNFSSLMQKLGFTQEEASELLDLSDAGDSNTIWKRLDAKMKGLKGEKLDMHADEFGALLRGLDLSESTKGKLHALFGANDELSLDSEQLQALLNGAGQEIGAKDLAARTLQSGLRDAVVDALDAAKLAELNAQIADKRGSRRMDQSEAMMHDSVQNRLDAKGNSIRGILGQSDQADRENAEFFDQNAREGQRTRAERIMATGRDQKPADTEKAAESKDAALEKLLSRLNVDAPLTGAHQAQFDQGQGNIPRTPQAARAEVFSQVENAILNTAQNGVQRLTLQLNPVECGQVTVVLTMREGELKATIKTDNEETAKALSENLEKLHASLEEQGLKVSELEVQVELQNNYSANGEWQGANEHNMMHDSQERDRFQRLARLRREAGQSIGNAVERTAAALSAQSEGLHIIA